MEDECKNCGATLKEGARFCPECGDKIERPPEKLTRPIISIVRTAETSLRMKPFTVTSAGLTLKTLRLKLKIRKA